MSKESKFSERVLSGVQPTGGLHLGNYLGAIKNFVPLQQKFESLFCVVDLHAITVWQEPSELVSKKCEVAAAFIASGIDPKKSIIFNQSQVPEHTQLSWILNCVARIGWLNRMTQFKDKAGKNRENVSVGLFTYPVLMASDILIYKATHVPVGEDQKQHLELARDIVLKFNNDFKREVFPLPKPIIMDNAARIMSLRDGTKKMSKSDESNYSRIDLKDTADEIIKKIKKAKSDSSSIPDNLKDLAEKPEALNLISVYANLSEKPLDQTLNEFKGKEYSYLKNKLSDVLVEVICPVGREIKKLLEDKSFLEKIIKEGTQKANTIAEHNLKEIKNVVGFF